MNAAFETQPVNVSVAANDEAVRAPKPFHQRKKVKKFTLGVTEKIVANILFAAMAAVFGAGAVMLFQPAQVTNPTMYVDAVTGCQYLMAGNGITPRLNRAGTQICSE